MEKMKDDKTNDYRSDEDTSGWDSDMSKSGISGTHPGYVMPSHLVRT